jgi:HrpA-like RNA helicase
VSAYFYSEAEFANTFLEHAPPEIKSTDLTPTVLLLMDWGCSRISDIMEELPFVDPPETGALNKAVELLVDLQAIQRKDNDRILRDRRDVIKEEERSSR